MYISTGAQRRWEAHQDFWLKSMTYSSPCSIIGTRGPGCRANLGLIHTLTCTKIGLFGKRGVSRFVTTQKMERFVSKIEKEISGFSMSHPT